MNALFFWIRTGCYFVLLRLSNKYPIPYKNRPLLKTRRDLSNAHEAPPFVTGTAQFMNKALETGLLYFKGTLC